MIYIYKYLSDLSNPCIFRIWKIFSTPGERTMHRERLIMEINAVQNFISDKFNSDHKAARSNLTELIFGNPN